MSSKSKTAAAKPGKSSITSITEWRRRNPAPRPIVTIEVPGQEDYLLDRRASDAVLFGAEITGLSPTDLVTRAVKADWARLAAEQKGGAR